MNSQCHMLTCRYNYKAECTNECEYKICIDVVKQVLGEDRYNSFLKWEKSEIKKRSCQGEYKGYVDGLQKEKEIILSQQKEPCEYCGVFDTLLLPVARKELCIKVRFCPNCGRRLNQFGTDINVATKTIVD